ncbi:MAG: hypothetical protein WAZ14_01575 [Patescibacteria group bacterium]
MNLVLVCVGDWHIGTNVPKSVEDLPNRHDRQHTATLTSVGTSQVIATGNWLRANGLKNFDQCLMPESRPARETAYRLGFEDAEWNVRSELTGHTWEHIGPIGNRDRYSGCATELTAQPNRDLRYWAPPKFEPPNQVIIRLLPLFTELIQSNDSGHSNALIVGDIDTLLAFQIMLERPWPSKIRSTLSSGIPAQQVHAGQCFHYTRTDPNSRVVATELAWSRNVLPHIGTPRLQAMDREKFMCFAQQGFTHEELKAEFGN